MDTAQPKKRGRPLGSKTGPLGPRIGSRTWALTNLPLNQSLYFEAPKSTATTMGQISTDIQRIGMSGKLVMSLLIAVQPKTREVIDLIRVTRVKA